LNLYQIQTKFRDEIRPRFGLMRGREFVMKDAYSFDRDDEGADRSYKAMYEAYMRIFRRLGLRFRAVEADSGAIGGSFSHEFMVLADTGEDAIAACGSCAYAANLERVEVRDSGRRPASVPPPLEEISTPGLKSIEAVSGFLRVEPRALVKTLLLRVDGRKVGALVRGDRTLNEVKVKNYFQAGLVELLEPEEARDLMGVPVGFAGPVDLKADCMLADYELREATGWIAGGNRPDTHLRNLDLGRDAKVTDYADLRDITGQDPCPRCGGPLSLPRGIEVGHVFKLGTKYSSAMRAVYLDESGEEKTMIMGCYGIGVSRVLAACIEQNHDGNGIIFPPAIAPFTVEVLPLDLKAEAVRDKALEIHDFLTAEGLDALLDDRDERPGVKFKDADLLGAPMQIIVGAKGLEKGVLEVKDRRSGEKSVLPAEDFAAALRAWKDGVLSGWSVPGT
jgi:prolyl-tRNA synthetase